MVINSGRHYLKPLQSEAFLVRQSGVSAKGASAECEWQKEALARSTRVRMEKLEEDKNQN